MGNTVQKDYELPGPPRIETTAVHAMVHFSGFSFFAL